MAQNIGYATLSIIPSAKGFGKTLSKDVDGQMLAAGKSGGNALMSGMAAPLGKLAAGIGGAIVGYAGLKAVIGGGLARQMQIENATAKLAGLGHSTDAISGIMQNALASVKGTAFGLGDAASVAAAMVASGIQPGVALTGVLKTVADTATIAGTDFQSMGAIFGSVAARGKLQGDDLLQLTSRGVPVLQFLGKQLGKTSAEISDMVSKGQIDFETFNAAMSANIGGAALASGNTTAGAIANMRAAFSRLGATLTGGVFPLFKEFFNVVTAVTDSIQTRLEATLGPLGARIQAAISPPLQALREQIPAVLDLLTSGDFNGKIRAALHVEEDSTLVSVILGIREAIVGMGQVIGDTLAPIGQGLRDVFSALGDSASTALPLLSPVGALLSILGSALPSLGSALGSVLTAIAPSLPSLAAAMASLVSAASQLVAALAPLAAGILTGIAQAVAAIAPPIINTVAAILNWISANSSWLSGLGVAAGVIGGVVVAINLFKAVQLAVAAATYGAQGAMVVAGTAAKLYGVLMNGLKAAQVIATAAQWAWNAALTANPIGIIITAIAALVAGIIWFFTQTEVGKKIWGEFTRFLGEAWTNIVNFATTVWNGLASFFTELWTNISNFVVSVWTGVSSFFTSLWTGIVDGFTNAWNSVIAFLTPVFEFIAGLIRFYVEMWINIFLVIAAVLVTIWNGIVEFVTPIVQFLVQVITDYINGLVTFWSAVWAAVAQFFTDTWNGLVAFIAPIVAAIASFITDTANNVSAAWNATWSAVSSFFSGIWNGIVNFLTPILVRIGSFVIDTARNASNTWNGIWSAVSSFFSGIWNSIVGAVSAGVNSVISTISGIYGQVMGVLSGVGDWLVSAGRNLIEGFWNGISGAIDWLKGLIEGAFNGVIDWAKGVLGIHSPSRVFKGIGAFVAEGFADGIVSMTGVVQAATEGMAQTAIDAADGTHLALNADVSGSIPDGGISGATARQLAELGAGGGSSSLEYHQHGGQGLTSEQELRKAARKLKTLTDTR